jgi:hypothetical protein
MARLTTSIVAFGWDIIGTCDARVVDVRVSAGGNELLRGRRQV